MTNYHEKHSAIIKICRLAVCFVLALILPLQAAYAAGATEPKNIVDPVRDKENISAVLYNNTNGLPTSEANAIAETSDGFIWIGSYSGLVRYDGNTFERIASNNGLGSVVSLFVDSKDRLWIGTNESGLALMEQGEFKFWAEDDGIDGVKITAIAEDESGSIYVGTTSGIAIVSPQMNLTAMDDPRIADTYIEHICSGADGLMYITTNEDDCITVRDGKVVDYIKRTETAIDGDITYFMPDRDNPGYVYLGTGDSDMFYGSDIRDAGKLEKIDISPLFSVIDLEQIGDRVWVCARNGIGVLDGKNFHSLNNLPMDNSVMTVMADYEGNLWFASARQGVMKIVYNQFSEIFTRFDLEERVVNTTCVLNGDLYIGTDTGLIALEDEGGPMDSIPLSSAVTASGENLGATDLLELLDGVRIRSIIRDSKNRLWISTWRGPGLLCYDNGAVTAYTEADGLLSDHIRSISEMNDGSILVANTGGVSVIKDGKVAKSYSKEDGIINPESLCVESAPGGDILVGSNGGGIYVINDNGTKTIGKEDGLSSEIVMRIKHDEKRNIYWLVTSNSIAYMTEDYKVATIYDFPYSNNFDLYENSNGDMWVLASNGIYVVPVEELLANEKIKPVFYSLGNGLPCTATSNSYSELTAEGNLYIAGSTGVAMINIDKPLEDVADVKHTVPYVEGDGEFYYPDEKGNFVIPASVRKLTIYGYVYNYSLTDPVVTYRLMGFDREPITVSRADLDPITYTNLSGGSYTFMMELRDAMGHGSNTIHVKITKEKKIFEQTWFYVAAGILLSMLLFLIIRLYVNRKMQSVENKHRERAEKERISHELLMASRIQQSLIPQTFPAFPEHTEFDLYALMRPAREVGGDFYDYFLIDDDHLCLVIADVSGKGIPAALFMAMSKTILQSFAAADMAVSEVLTKTNDRICAGNKTDMFVTVWMGILELSTGKMKAANAGHEYPAVMRSGGNFELLKDKHGFVIGGLADITYAEYELQLDPGDKLFVYTDGVPEATNADTVMFGTDRMIDTLNRDPGASSEELLRRLEGDVRQFVGKAEQFDDFTMLCVEYKGQ